MFRKNYNLGERLYYFSSDPLETKGSKINESIDSGVVEAIKITSDGVTYTLNLNFDANSSKSVDLIDIKHNKVYKSLEDVYKKYCELVKKVILG